MTIFASAEEGAPVTTTLELAEGERKEGVEVVLQTGAEIAGVVVDSASGEPLAGIQVIANPEGPWTGGIWRGGQAFTGQDGRFTLSGLLPGSYQVAVGSGWGAGGSEHSPETRKGVKTGTTDLRFELERGLAVAGRPVSVQAVMASIKGSDYARARARGRGRAVHPEGAGAGPGQDPGLPRGEGRGLRNLPGTRDRRRGDGSRRVAAPVELPAGSRYFYDIHEL